MAESKLYLVTRIGGEDMATIIHEHTKENGNSSGAVIGLIILLVLALLFFMYGLPMIRSYQTPQVNVPGKIDVNVNTPQK